MTAILSHFRSVCVAGAGNACLDRLSDAYKVDTEINGTHEATETGKNHGSEGRTRLMENGVMEIDPPHGSVMGSNGYVLSKPQQDTAATQHRTNWSPSGTTTAGHAAKTLPSAALHACTLGTQKTDTSAFPTLGEGKIEAETKNGTSLNPPPPPVVVHRARKTMSRPASNQTLKVTYQPVDPHFQ